MPEKIALVALIMASLSLLGGLAVVCLDRIKNDDQGR